ncbi:PQQ-binding-like beta-propeller repeat protein [Actinoplanes sp. NPDC049668]|uniref:outer membrane protein assembly factor BamB family protein n=1 Tax=unclassified Actinoplanes TaxID=2626549 RepID=UPI0033BF5358
MLSRPSARLLALITGAVLITLVPSAAGHRRVGAPAEPPAAGVVTRWERAVGDADVALDAGSESLALLDLVAGPRGRHRVEVVDARRGTVRWTGTTSGRWVTGRHHRSLATTPGGLAFLAGDEGVDAVSLATGRVAWRAGPGEGGDPVLAGDLILLKDGGVRALDAESGVPRWRWAARACADRVIEIDAGTADGPTVRCGDAVTRLGPGDGRPRWSRAAPGGCYLMNAVAGAGFVAVADACGDVGRIRVLDGGTGRERWSRAVAREPGDFDGTDGVEMFTAGGTQLIRAADQTDILYRVADGRPVLLPAGSEPVEPTGSPTNGLLARRDDGRTMTLTMVDPATGEPRWERVVPLPAADHPFRTRKGFLYLVGSAPPLWPGILAAVDERSGDVTLSGTGLADTEVIGADADGSVLLQSGPQQRGRISRLGTGGGPTGFLGTSVAAGRWPDACRLLTAADYEAAYPGVRPELRPEPVMDAPAPGCRLLPPSIDGTTVVVAVVWLASDDASASSAARVQAEYARGPVPARAGGRAAWVWTGDELEPDDDSRHLLSLAVGRCVATVRAYGDGGPLRRLGGAVADRLAASPSCSAV